MGRPPAAPGGAPATGGMFTGVGVVGADVVDFHGGPVVVHLHTLKTHPDIGLDVLDQMAQMNGAIGIGQRGGDEDAALRHGCSRVKVGERTAE